MKDDRPLLSVKNICKRFPGVYALKGVDFKVYQGEIHALIGENGAGKSTLMKIILGIHKPTSGEMVFQGEIYSPKSPVEALGKGISMIHQEISLIPTISVSENIWIGRESKFGNKYFIDAKKQREATREILARLGLTISPDVDVSQLSIAEMQLVEIARAVSYDSDIIIMDEPTSALTNTEVEKLFDIIRDLSKKGKSIIFISHKLDEIRTICDSVTVFRDGEFIDRSWIKDVTQEQLVNKMVGREMNDMFPKEDAVIGTPVLEVEHLSRGNVVNDVSFTVRQGEILGFAGLMGAGRTEIMQCLFGIDKKDSGVIKLNGKEVTIHNSSDAINNKMAMVTEDRLHGGVIHSLSVKINTTLAYLKKVTKVGFVDIKKEKSDAEEMVKKLSIKIPSLDSEIALLSGGNQQKVIIAKWLLTQPEVLIMDEPTRGVDVGAKSEIYRLIGLLAKQGKAIIIVSSELPEVMGISDRILVIKDGSIAGELERTEFDSDKIMKCAFGVE